jgi:hypothetical protein
MAARTCSTLLAVCLGLNVLLLLRAESGSNDLRGEPFSLLGKTEPIAGDFFEGFPDLFVYGLGRLVPCLDSSATISLG